MIRLLLLAFAVFALESNFPHRLDHRPTERHHQPETMPGGVAAIDFDNDGWLDVAFANAAGPLTLHRNQRDGTFADVTSQSGLLSAGYSMALAAADYDNDGQSDLFVAGLERNALWRNAGGGKFEDVTGKAGIAGAAQWSIGGGWFDYDRDGRLDLFVVRYVRYDARNEVFCGAADRSYRTYCHPRFYPAISNLLYRNEGGGRFRDVSAESGIAKFLGKGMSVAFGDVDQDGWLDVFVTNDTVPNFLFRNRGDGTFAEIGLSSGVGVNDDGLELSSMGVDIRDLDGDGKEDIFVTALANESFPIFRNLGKLQFFDTTYAQGVGGKVLPYSGWAAGCFDFDNDGEREIFIAAGDVQNNTEKFSSRKSKQPAILLKRNRKGMFELTEVSGAAWHRGAAFGDFDNDGRMEAIVTRLGETPLFWRPASPGGNHWIGFELRGTRSNRQGLGAMVRVKTSAGEQWNRAATAVGYASASDARVHFGLGGAGAIKEVEVVWPSGLRQRVEGARVDRYNRVEEGMR